jgi:hypothetical protein
MLRSKYSAAAAEGSSAAGVITGARLWTVLLPVACGGSLLIPDLQDPKFLTSELSRDIPGIFSLDEQLVS